MSGLSTHVLDLVSGKPAAGMRVGVTRYVDGVAHPLGHAVTNADGRIDRPLVEAADLAPGVYELTFHVGDYFAGTVPDASDTVPFLDIVPLRFGIADPSLHHHIPLLVTPWGYSTYRGS